MSDDDWRSWKHGKNDNRYKGVKRHSGKRGYKRIIKLSLVIIGALIFGFFIFQNYVTSQTSQKESNDIIANTVNTIQQMFSQVSKQTTFSSMPSDRLTATPNKILTEDNYFAQLVPSNIQVIGKGRYNMISFTVNVNVQDLPFDGNVFFEDLYTTLEDENSKVYHPDPAECSLNDLIPIIGKESNNATYNVCYSVDKTSNKFSILYTEPPYNYHMYRAGHLSLDSNLFDYYKSHYNSQPIQIGIIDLAK